MRLRELAESAGLMADQSQLEKDVAAFRSHLIDKLEDLKNTVEGIELATQNRRDPKLLNWLIVIGFVIAGLIAPHVQFPSRQRVY